VIECGENEKTVACESATVDMPIDISTTTKNIKKSNHTTPNNHTTTRESGIWDTFFYLLLSNHEVDEESVKQILSSASRFFHYSFILCHPQ